MFLEDLLRKRLEELRDRLVNYGNTILDQQEIKDESFLKQYVVWRERAKRFRTIIDEMEEITKILNKYDCLFPKEEEM